MRLNGIGARARRFQMEYICYELRVSVFISNTSNTISIVKFFLEIVAFTTQFTNMLHSH